MLNIADIKEAADNDETPDATDEDCIYKLDAKLLSGDNLLSERDNTGKVIIPAKYDYDESGIYVPYTAEYQRIGCIEFEGMWYEDDDHKTSGSRFHTEDNIYLKIHRVEDTKAAILIKCTWTRKANDEYIAFNSFNIECTWGEILDKYAKIDAKGNVKSNKLNQKASITGRDISIPASKGSYVAFIEDMRRDILLSSGLEVLKIKNYEWPEIPDDDEEDAADIPSCFNDYPEDIQDGAMYLINNNLLLDNIIRTVSYVQEGNNDFKRSLILIPTTAYVKEPQQTMLDGKRGAGKTSLILEIAKNLPDKDIFHYQSFSAKTIFYDKDKFNPDGVNILILDDVDFNNEEKVASLKILTDNTKRVKTLHTVINQKAVEFKLTGKFLCILTYAKEIPDEELANRLHNSSLIVADDEKGAIKNKIKTNTVTDIIDNAAVMKMREYNKCAFQYLSERKMKIFNLFTLFLDVSSLGNRDIPDLISTIIANSFYNYSNLKSVTINDKELLIGSFKEVEDNLKVWEDDEYQSEKLSSREKECLKILPEMTINEAEEEVTTCINELDVISSYPAAKRHIESKFYTKDRIAEEMELNKHTVTNFLDRSSKDGVTTRSLMERGLVEAIIIEDNIRYPNKIYYKPIRETVGKPSNPENNMNVRMYNEYTSVINTLNAKQSILINLLIYINIILNKTGYMYLKKYCSSYDKEMDKDDYDSYYDFIHDFIDGLNDNHCIDINAAGIDDLISSTEYMGKILEDIPDEIEDKITSMTNIPDNALNENQSNFNECDDKIHPVHPSEFKNKERIEGMGYDFSIIQKLSDILRIRWITAEEILKNHYELFDILPDGTNDELVIGIANSLKKMYDDGLANKNMKNGQMYYTMTERQYDFINAKVDVGSDAA